MYTQFLKIKSQAERARRENIKEYSFAGSAHCLVVAGVWGDWTW